MLPCFVLCILCPSTRQQFQHRSQSNVDYKSVSSTNWIQLNLSPPTGDKLRLNFPPISPRDSSCNNKLNNVAFVYESDVSAQNVAVVHESHMSPQNNWTYFGALVEEIIVKCASILIFVASEFSLHWQRGRSYTSSPQWTVWYSKRVVTL